jgi:5'-3' exonuclease
MVFVSIVGFVSFVTSPRPFINGMNDCHFQRAMSRYTVAGASLDVYLIDGTYELFRHFYAVPSARDGDGREVGAVRGVLGSVLGMINHGVTHLGVATDHVIESFRNGLWPEYKTSAGVDPQLLSQFGLLEEALAALGVAVWPMVEFEADDALAAAATTAAGDDRVDRVIICTPDKDLAQCVRGERIVQLNRRTKTTRNESAVIAKFGVPPTSIPDYLALVGDAADGYPGLPGWGSKSTAAVLGRFGHIESIPDDWRTWSVNAASPAALARTLARERDLAFLFRDLATLRTGIPLFESVDELRWTGPTDAFATLAERLDVAVPVPPRRIGGF